MSKRSIKLLIDKLNVEKGNQRGVASIYIGNNENTKAKKKTEELIFHIGDLGEKQKRSKVVGNPLPFGNGGSSYRATIPYFTNIIIKQSIHCHKVILKVLNQNNRTSLMNACMVKDNIDRTIWSKITVDFRYHTSGWSVFNFAVLCCNDKGGEC